MDAHVDNAGNISINVDIHCHMFNATDIPINGFVHHVALHDGLMSGALADLAARLVSGAPGFAADKARLSGILGGGDGILAGGEELAAAVPADSGVGIEDNFEAQVDEAVSQLSDEEVALIQSEPPADRPEPSAAAEAEGPEALSPEALSPEGLSLGTP
jgi:hypothetical protein